MKTGNYEEEEEEQKKQKQDNRQQEQEEGEVQLLNLRWAVRSSSVMQAPRGDLSSGMLAVSRLLCWKWRCRTGCLQGERGAAEELHTETD